MNRLTLGALTALASTQIAGCIITSDNHVQEDAYITVNWQLKNVGSNVLAPCPPGYDTMAFYSQETDANGNPFGQQFIDLFPCNAGTATSDPLPPSTYVSWVEITNSNNTSTFAKSLAAYVDVRFEDKFFDTAIFLNGGYIQVDWNLADAVTRQPLLCENVQGLANITVQASYGSPIDFFEHPYPCEDYTAITAGLGARTYTVVLEPVNVQDQSLGPAVTIPGVEVFSHNELNHLRDPATLLID